MARIRIETSGGIAGRQRYEETEISEEELSLLAGRAEAAAEGRGEEIGSGTLTYHVRVPESGRSYEIPHREGAEFADLMELLDRILAGTRPAD